MTDDGGNSVLFVHYRDITSPIGTIVPYYLTNELADSSTVHVVCRKQETERALERDERDVVVHDVDTGEVAVLSAIAFHLLSTLYVAVIGLRYRFDATYCFQNSLVQGWVGSRTSGSRLVVGLQSVPVRQARNFADNAHQPGGVRERLALSLLSLYARVVRHLLASASAVVCLTEGIAAVTAEIYDVDLSHAHVLGMGVDVEQFDGVRASGPSPHRADGLTITYVGSIHDSRDLGLVLEAISELRHDVHFRIAGQGDEQCVSALRETADELGVADRVEWLGLVPHEEVPRLLSTSDLAISPLPDIESFRISFPAKVLEYMAAGSVTIATDIPAHRRLIEDGTNGHLYDGSREDLVATIERCIENGHDRDAIARRARETAEDYDWEVIVARHEAVLFDSTPPRARHSSADDGRRHRTVSRTQ